jgi:hypothetical protein
MSADSSEIATLEARLKSCAKKLHLLAVPLGHAKQVRTFDSDRRKNLLARYMVKHLQAGESATAAEAYARADESYQRELGLLADDLRASEAAIAEWDAEMCSWDSARSLLSMQKEVIKQIE